ncbi:hypothetical protein BMW23_0273 [Bodo saltans virus]|uniref:Transmembrane protein n=1 Tax=Bodo saltans virus TaxID=2024608 RepID=A0A2H4UTR8_9VIRU|nr:hypothetical protein QJ851_gp0268 [Bodo saltans virus]ATZ80331.1 hypothetical protein BMW23_0273 [Bodo saltans virus]
MYKNDKIDLNDDSIYDYVIEDTLTSYVPKRKENEDIETFIDDSSNFEIPFFYMIFVMVILALVYIFFIQ